MTIIRVGDLFCISGFYISIKINKKIPKKNKVNRPMII